MDTNHNTPPEQLAARVESGFMNAEDGQRSHPFRRFRSIGGRSGVDAGYVERIEAELVLLREENARLRMERAQRPDAGPMIDRLKSLSAAAPPDEDQRDQAWHLIGEALVMREVLIDVCKEIGQTTITLQTRLNDLGLDLPGRDEAPAALEAQPSIPSPFSSAR